MFKLDDFEEKIGLKRKILAKMNKISMQIRSFKDTLVKYSSKKYQFIKWEAIPHPLSSPLPHLMLKVYVFLMAPLGSHQRTPA